MSRRRGPAFVALVAVFLIGFSVFGVLGCGGGSDARATDSDPPWALRLPQGARYGAWSPDGELFALPGHSRIDLIGTDGSLARRIDIPGINNSGFSCECRVGWAEDGAEIHAVTRPMPKARGGIATVDANGKNLRVRYLDLHVSDATWAPQGWPLVLKPGNTDTHPGRPHRESSYLLRLGSLEAGLDTLLKRKGYVSDLTFSPDGSRIVFTVGTLTGGRESLWTISQDGGKPRLLLGGLLKPSVAWSPDGRELALTVLSEGRRQVDLLLVSTASGKTSLLSSGTIAEEPPAWTPDGRWVTYVAADNLGVDGSVNKIRRNGTAQQRLFLLPGEEISGLSWSPDGGHLAYTARPIPPTD